MSTPPAAKRRRVDSLGIHKPFVSPLKRIVPSTTANQTSPAQPTSIAKQTSTGNPISTPAPLRTQAVSTPAIPYTPLRSSNLRSSTPLHQHNPHDPDIAQAQQDIKAFEARIRILRSQNGILAQAAQITTPASSQQPNQASQPSQSSQAEPPNQQQPQQQTRLARLSQKWLRASQSAAEEVFSSFEQSIKDNGGFSTFLAQQKKQSTSNSFFGDNFDDGKDGNEEENEDNWRDEEGHVLTERGKRQRRAEVEHVNKVYKHRREKEEEGQEGAEDEEEEQELTLGVMLKVLNIDPEVIEWDTKTLAWKCAGA